MPRRPFFAASLGLVLVLAAFAAQAEPYELSDCPEVVIVLEDPVEPDGTVGPKVAELACEKLRLLAPKFGVQLTGSEMVRLMIADDPDAFVKHTGRGRNTQAIYSDRTGIITQPAKQVRRMHKRKALGGLLAHELTHFLVNRVTDSRCPTWIHEGLAQWFEGRPSVGAGPASVAELMRLEAAWRVRGNLQMQMWCYRESLALMTRLMGVATEASVMAALPGLAEHTGNHLSLPLGEKTLRAHLFPDDPGPRAAEPPTSQIQVIRGKQGANSKADGKVTPIDLKSLMEKAKKENKTR